MAGEMRLDAIPKTNAAAWLGRYGRRGKTVYTQTEGAFWGYLVIPGSALRITSPGVKPGNPLRLSRF